MKPMPKKLLPLLRRGQWTFPLAALAALAMFAISEGSYQQARATLEELVTQGTARTTIQTMWRNLTHAETGQRGYLLTHRKEYLLPYTEAQGQVEQSLAWLSQYYSTEPAAHAAMQELVQASRDKFTELAETIRLFDAGDELGAHTLVLSNLGKDQMGTVRRLSESLLAVESTKVAAGRRSVNQTLMLSRIGANALAALSLLALFMYLRQTTALVRLREEQRRIMQVERDQLGHDAVGRTEQLTQLTRHLQTVREEERNRLARELHDELGAWLTAAKLDVARLKSRLGVLTPEVAERIKHLTDGLNSIIAMKRRIIEDLHPSALANLGLVAALEILVREWGEHREITVDSEFEPVQLRPSGELTVYRLVQEALTNTAKYAQASEVQVRLSATDGQVQVSVRDNGIGFDMSQRHASAHGLLGMRFRLEAEGGRVVLHSSPGQGTLVLAELPESVAPA